MFLRIIEVAAAVMLLLGLFGWIMLPRVIKLYRRLRNGKSG